MKKVLFLSFVALLISSIVLAAHVYPDKKEAAAEKGPWRFTHFDPRVRTVRFQEFIYLEQPSAQEYKGVGRGGYPPFLWRATVYLRTSESAGYPRTAITVNTKDLPSSFSERCYFEVWLVDDDTDYALSLGMFFTSMGGSAEFNYNYNNYVGAYDRILITKEPFYDENPLPGEIVLEGLIEKNVPDFFEPQPKPSMMMTDVIKEEVI